jgi:hypothetical protein
MLSRTSKIPKALYRADCTVVALSAVAGIPMDQARTIAKAAGKVDGKGFYSSKLMAKAVERGLVFKRVTVPSGLTLSHFIYMYPKGRYFAKMKGHAFGIIDGKVADRIVSSSTRVLEAWVLERNDFVNLNPYAKYSEW